MSKLKAEIANGLIGSISLLIFYFIIMSIASRSLSATVSQFKELWYWTVPLVIGFGVQIGLYTKLKSTIQNPRLMKSGKTMAATAGTTSSISMVACCAHHLSDALPLIGLSGTAVFLTKYQVPLIIVGITMNFFGIVYMFRMIRKIKSSRERKSYVKNE